MTDIYVGMPVKSAYPGNSDYTVTKIEGNKVTLKQNSNGAEIQILKSELMPIKS